MKAIDPFYTPYEIAVKMISHATHGSKKFIVDFAAGKGELLKVASMKWPKSQLIATDICKNTISSLQRAHPDWLVGRCDFTNPRSLNRCRFLKDKKGKIPLVLLNPPFSCRGASYITVNINGDKINCSPAIAFILLSIAFLTRQGQILAILPAGSIKSQRDRAAWDLLHRLGKLRIIDTNGENTFLGCSAISTIISFKKYKAPIKSTLESSTVSNRPLSLKQNIGLEIYRGRISMHALIEDKSKTGVPFIHSTELEEIGINLKRYKIQPQSHAIIGPAILIPRVGKPKKNKIHLYNNDSPIVLSDCVIALLCKSIEQAEIIKSLLLKNWFSFEKKYSGTCAKYITIESITELLMDLGCENFKSLN